MEVKHPAAARTFAKIAFRTSLQSAEPARAAPYPNNRVAGMSCVIGTATAVAPLGSIVRPSIAYLNKNGTCAARPLRLALFDGEEEKNLPPFEFYQHNPLPWSATIISYVCK